MSPNAILPAGYEDLGALAARWARSTENARSAIRWSASAADFAEFYSAVLPRLPEILTTLAGYPLAGMTDPQVNLFNLAAAFAEAAPHHELYGGSADVPFSFAAHRFVPGHGDLPSNTEVLR
ncbi:hypothetical protein H7F50_00305 [Novosphingobium flavum]|uniref:hypothetical protein n=1 Tax=Novosphingobium aerophilum TaxID=2839843 RepID=UPI0016396C3B|nr:hypothetical protein [Novosphingobium aerophilum]MBC2660178.1 hypothetical protein [Novosphingobium aerophilum]